MISTSGRVSVPLELTSYYKTTDILSTFEKKVADIKPTSDIEITRNNKGCVSSIIYYTPEREIEKEIFFTNSNISKINYYKGKTLCRTEAFKNNLLTLKFLFLSNGYLSCSYEYEYDAEKRVNSICKKLNKKELLVVYKYDDVGRIISRKMYKNNEPIIYQHYKYDILDRIIEYQDDNQHIIVNKITPNNELISYVIIDKMGNKIIVENLFSPLDYVETTITLNEHSSRIKDTSYVDNVMLKKPYASEDDLDFVIANLFNSTDFMSTKREVNKENQVTDIINTSIQYRTLPISMRKRLLLERATI